MTGIRVFVRRSPAQSITLELLLVDGRLSVLLSL